MRHKRLLILLLCALFLFSLLACENLGQCRHHRRGADPRSARPAATR